MRTFFALTFAIGLAALITHHVALIIAAGVMGLVALWNVLRPEVVELAEPSLYSRTDTRGRRR